MVVAPPGKLLILSLALGLENFQMKKASRNCEARNEMPASSMVSAYCSSMRWPWVEISGGIGHMCMTMGIAEAIAITTMVTASIFAISRRLFAGILRPCWNRRSFGCGDSVIQFSAMAA